MSINNPYRGVAELPSIIPVFPLASVLLLPQTDLPLNIFEPRYIAMVDEALRTTRLIGMIQPVPDQPADVHVPQLQKIGCLGRITQFSEPGDGRYSICLTGVARYRIDHEEDTAAPFRVCRVSFSDYAHDLSEQHCGVQPRQREILRIIELFEKSRGIKVDRRAVQGVPEVALIDALSMKLQFSPRATQELLEARDAFARAEMLLAIAEMEFSQLSGNRRNLQ